MQGFNVLFQPGYDHAGISTQNAVEKALLAEGTSRQELGREAFEARVWDWLREYGGKIMIQFRRMGASLDYRRERFTMDEGYVRAVMRFFVHLYDKGWIYRDNRIINWCPYHQTSLSDLELVDVEVDDTLSTIRYPLADGTGFIAIATVRPATIPADVAIAVHPDDERYRHLVGKEAIVPFVERRVPIIADERVEPDFGTGALKITPGHDPKDFEIGRDHGLPELTVIGPDGLMNDEVPELAGLTQKEAEERILEWARERGLLEKREHYRHAVPVCERCETQDRAADLAPMVVLDDRAEAAGSRCAARASGRLPPGVAASVRDRVARRGTGLEHLAADLVGPPDPDLVLPERARDLRGDDAGRVHGVRLDRADARDGRAGHVVLLGVVAVRDARLARRDARSRGVLPRATSRRRRGTSSVSGRTA